MDIDEGENSPSSDTDPTKNRWVLEMARAKPKTKGKDNRIVGFGSFYKRRPFNYSKKEFLADQGHRDRIRTADCTEADKAERDQANDDSGRESDWHSCSCIRPGKYEARKAAEVDLKFQRNNKRAKHSC